jgi:hypothetical protein
MNQFQINANNYLYRPTTAFFHVPYTGMGKSGNPDYLNHLKNTFNSFSSNVLQSAVQELRRVLCEDLFQISKLPGFSSMVVCVVPRSKSENTYHANQQLFLTTVQAVIAQIPGFIDGTNYLCRHTNTKTTHLRREVKNYNNDGLEPYPGITGQTCNISPHVRGRDILLVDDIYTPGVNIDEDAINALLIAGARSVTFYAVGKV